MKRTEHLRESIVVPTRIFPIRVRKMFFSVEAYVPDGVICLMSAARYYGLFGFLLDAVDVVVARRRSAHFLNGWRSGSIILIRDV